MEALKPVIARLIAWYYRLLSHHLFGRDRSRHLDVDFYRQFYRMEAAIAEMNAEQAYIHFLVHGRAEGRHPNKASLINSLRAKFGDLPGDFNPDTYLRLNPDLAVTCSFPGAAELHYVTFGRIEGRNFRAPPTSVYDPHLLTLMINRVNDMPDVVVDPSAEPRINVLVPAFDFTSMSAGFFGVFQVARYIAKQGHRVRLVMFDNFYWNEHEFRQKLLGYPEMEHLFDELEIAYIGERKAPLPVSPRDNCVATVWYSAYFAKKIMEAIGGQKFLYLIQDYEAGFYPGSALSALAAETYKFNFNAFFSSRSLQDFFLDAKIGAFAKRAVDHEYFNNACAASLMPISEFVSKGGRVKRLALYSRPAVNRNMFELAALALCQAHAAGVFANETWEFYGIGIGDLEVRIAEGVTLHQLPRVNLREYQDLVATFDIGLSLMASAHPSLLPFDLGGSGALVVTNTFANKQQPYFDNLCANVIAKEPTLPDLVDGLREAVRRASDREARHRNAARMTYPKSWNDAFLPRHDAFIERALRDSRPAVHAL